MSDQIEVGDLTLAPGVLETIVTLAAREVEGVSSLCGDTQGLAGLAQKAMNKQAATSVEVSTDGEKLSASLHIEVEYGKSLREVAAAVQEAVADAVTHQVGAEIDSVDVFVDGIHFEG